MHHAQRRSQSAGQLGDAAVPLSSDSVSYRHFSPRQYYTLSFRSARCYRGTLERIKVALDDVSNLVCLALAVHELNDEC